ncbi:MAG: hypothetical protein JWQ98_3343 [Chlorobi bacterium]|nr:hypothetical protein [Chlorobiota bacterium]
MKDPQHKLNLLIAMLARMYDNTLAGECLSEINDGNPIGILKSRRTMAEIMIIHAENNKRGYSVSSWTFNQGQLVELP